MRSSAPTAVRFRFETTNVHIISMVQKGVPWERIQSNYVAPTMPALSSQVSYAVVNFMLDVAFGLLTKFVLKFPI